MCGIVDTFLLITRCKLCILGHVQNTTPPFISIQYMVLAYNTDCDSITRRTIWGIIPTVCMWALTFHHFMWPKNGTAMVTRVVPALQQQAFAEEITTLKAWKELGYKLLPLWPFLDQDGLLHVGGKLGLSEQPDPKCHPLILSAKHQLTKLIIQNEHLRLLQAGSTPVMHSRSYVCSRAAVTAPKIRPLKPHLQGGASGERFSQADVHVAP